MTFQGHLKAIIGRTNKTISLLRWLQNLLPGSAFLRLYKAFVRPYLDNHDVRNDETYNEFFHREVESLQCNVCLALTGTIQGIFKEKLYYEPGFEFHQL